MTEQRVGFFTRTDAKAAAYKKGRTRTAALPTETLHRLGPKAVARMNPNAKHPEMPPDGEGRSTVYVLGEYPSAADDQDGVPFSDMDDGAEWIRNILDKTGAEVTYDNAVRTRPPKGRKPKEHEVEAFRKVVEKDIEEARPKIVLAVGAAAARWCLPKLPGVSARAKTLRGRFFPAKIGDHTCWVAPLLSPHFILRLGKKREDKIPGKEWERIFTQDVRRAVKWGQERRAPTVENLDGVEDRIIPVTTARGVKELLAQMVKYHGKPVGLDYETNGTRPYRKGARVLSFSVGDSERAWSVPLDHPDHPWPTKIRRRLLNGLRRLLENASEVRAQNSLFEAEWSLHLFGPELIRDVNWQDTMLQAFALDQRKGAHNLDFLCQYRLGVPLKSISGVDRKNLADAPLERLLPYNGLDVVYTDRLFLTQASILERTGLSDAYHRHRRRIATLAMAQARGLPVSQRTRRKLQDEFGAEVKKAEEALRKTEGVRTYEKKHGKYLPGSSQANLVLFRDILEREEGEDGRGGYSADEGALSKMRGCPEAHHLIEYRGLAKCKGTYIDRFDPGHEKSYVYPDGLVHCSFNIIGTKSSRLSSEDPNNQNWPKRDKRKKVVRRQIRAPKGYVLISVDQGQIEARCIGMHSEDRSFCQALWDNYDVHMEWAERAAELCPRSFKIHGKGDMRAYRGVIKNGLVFPAFYLSMPKSIGNSMDFDDRTTDILFAEFWETFAGVKRWQNKLVRGYRKTGHVDGLTGRRYYGPLSENMVVNLPIQGLASDIVIDSMDRLSVLSVVEDKPWLQPILNIHDDLTFLVPLEHEEDAIVTIVEEMLDTSPFPFINVPLSVEVERGTNWLDMVEVGTFSSEEL